MRPDADDQVFLHLRAGQAEPAGTRRGRCTQAKQVRNPRLREKPHGSGLTGPAGLLGLASVMPVSVVLLLAAPPFSLGGSLPAAPPRLRPVQVKEELRCRLLKQEVERAEGRGSGLRGGATVLLLPPLLRR